MYLFQGWVKASSYLNTIFKKRNVQKPCEGPSFETKGRSPEDNMAFQSSRKTIKMVKSFIYCQNNEIVIVYVKTNRLKMYLRNCTILNYYINFVLQMNVPSNKLLIKFNMWIFPINQPIQKIHYIRIINNSIHLCVRWLISFNSSFISYYYFLSKNLAIYPHRIKWCVLF